ncbi:protein-tyrosine phosphatase [Rhodococcus sp. 27YEA15]|uniref:protein-tyrosine phosphatase family protein n=1 Tax=Rhodococcus sp. 27YEA15 TaxID=3156259 RepID=UPI003C7CCB24
MTTTWDHRASGVLELPSGRKVRGRGLRHAVPDGPSATFDVYLTGRTPPPTPWEARWIRWRDFWLPSDRTAFGRAVEDIHARAERERVEIACGGGFGRTGTALACLAVADGVSGNDAVAYVREHYSPRAVEMPWQRCFVTDFARRRTPPAVR